MGSFRYCELDPLFLLIMLKKSKTSDSQPIRTVELRSSMKGSESHREVKTEAGLTDHSLSMLPPSSHSLPQKMSSKWPARAATFYTCSWISNSLLKIKHWKWFCHFGIEDYIFFDRDGKMTWHRKLMHFKATSCILVNASCEIAFFHVVTGLVQ